MIAPELMDHVAILLIWKEFLLHRGCSFHVQSILDADSSLVEKKSKEGRQTVFFTPKDPWGDETEEEFDGDLTKPRKVHYKNNWKYSQDAVYWIHLAKALEMVLKFWQTRSHDSVPADCIEKVVSENGECQRLSTPRPAPRIILKSVRNLLKQQRQQQQDTLGSTGTHALAQT